MYQGVLLGSVRESAGREWLWRMFEGSSVSRTIGGDPKANRKAQETSAGAWRSEWRPEVLPRDMQNVINRLIQWCREGKKGQLTPVDFQMLAFMNVGISVGRRLIEILSMTLGSISYKRKVTQRQVKGRNGQMQMVRKTIRYLNIHIGFEKGLGVCDQGFMMQENENPYACPVVWMLLYLESRKIIENALAVWRGDEQLNLIDFNEGRYETNKDVTEWSLETQEQLNNRCYDAEDTQTRG